MFEQFTERARRVVILAQEEAKRLNHSAVGTEHILLGIIREGENVASKALESLNISLKGVRAEIESAIGRGERATLDEIAFTGRAKKVLELALSEARRLKHNYIGTEHLLLGLIVEGEGAAAVVLKAMGADLERVRAQVIYVLGEGRPSDKSMGAREPDLTIPDLTIPDLTISEMWRPALQVTRRLGMMRRTWAEVDLDAVASNAQALAAFVKPAALMVVVKAEAYGHGAVPVSYIVLHAGATCLGVATIEEGIALRKAGVQAPVLVLGVVRPSDLGETHLHRLDVTLGPEDFSDDGAYAALLKKARNHLKVDTGMSRLGVPPERVPQILNMLERRGIPLDGCYTHLACADDPDPTFTREQLARFHHVLGEVRARHPRVVVHAANSAAALAYPESHFDMVRVGLAVYGLYPAPHLRARVPLHPAMTLKSRVVRVSRADAGTTVSYGATYRTSAPTTIATIACGYGDGYPRLTNEHSAVLIRGRRAPIVGRVTMDYLMVDVGDGPVTVGDEAILFGQELSADEVASWAQSISYEILCRVGPRVPRVYLRKGREGPSESVWG